MARGYNKAILIGNLARDPEVRYTANNTAVASTAIAVNRSWRGQNGEQREEVDFIPIVLWGKLAEFSERYLKKGSSVLVEGRISIRSYESKSGEKRYVTEVVADNVQFAGSARRADSAAEGRDDEGLSSDSPRSDSPAESLALPPEVDVYIPF